MVTPSSFTSSSQLMLQPFKLSVLCLCVLSPMAIAWNFSGFACILFTENHEIKITVFYKKKNVVNKNIEQMYVLALV